MACHRARPQPMGLKNAVCSQDTFFEFCRATSSTMAEITTAARLHLLWKRESRRLWVPNIIRRRTQLCTVILYISYIIYYIICFTLLHPGTERRECRGKVQIFKLQRNCRAANPRERARPWQGKMSRRQSNLAPKSDTFRPIRVSTLNLYGIVSRSRVRCERTAGSELHSWLTAPFSTGYWMLPKLSRRQWRTNTFHRPLRSVMRWEHACERGYVNKVMKLWKILSPQDASHQWSTTV